MIKRVKQSHPTFYNDVIVGGYHGVDGGGDTPPYIFWCLIAVDLSISVGILLEISEVWLVNYSEEKDFHRGGE